MLTSSYAPAQQAGNGVTLAFSFSFKILTSSDLAVYKIDSSGIQSSQLILGTDYTVSFDPIAETGTVTYTTAPVSGGYSLIKRVTEVSQETSLPREGPAPAKTIETMIDKLTAIAQEIEATQALIIVTSSGTVTGTFAELQAYAALNPSVAFHGIATDQRIIYDYLGDTALGAGGFAAVGGY